MDDPSSKVIVFSQWEDVLTIVERALVANNIPSTRIKGSTKINQKLHTFKTNALMPVLLLPLKSGANGLNLIEANHVIMVEPLLDGGVERQAINRVHRIGQTRETHVHRFLVKNTIEMEIHRRREEATSSEGNGSDERGESVNDRRIMSLSDLKRLFGLCS